MCPALSLSPESSTVPNAGGWPRVTRRTGGDFGAVSTELIEFIGVKRGRKTPRHGVSVFQ